MKKISVLIPCYNEEENIIPMSEAVRSQFEKHLPSYDWELIFFYGFHEGKYRFFIKD